jgi:hypothetical protein
MTQHGENNQKPEIHEIHRTETVLGRLPEPLELGQLDAHTVSHRRGVRIKPPLERLTANCALQSLIVQRLVRHQLGIHAIGQCRVSALGDRARIPTHVVRIGQQTHAHDRAKRTSAAVTAVTAVAAVAGSRAAADQKQVTGARICRVGVPVASTVPRQCRAVRTGRREQQTPAADRRVIATNELDDDARGRDLEGARQVAA